MFIKQKDKNDKKGHIITQEPSKGKIKDYLQHPNIVQTSNPHSFHKLKADLIKPSTHTRGLKKGLKKTRAGMYRKAKTSGRY